MRLEAAGDGTVVPGFFVPKEAPPLINNRRVKGCAKLSPISGAKRHDDMALGISVGEFAEIAHRQNHEMSDRRGKPSAALQGRHTPGPPKERTIRRRGGGYANSCAVEPAMKPQFPAMRAAEGPDPWRVLARKLVRSAAPGHVRLDGRSAGHGIRPGCACGISKGRERIDDGIPFASQSHHYPNLLFCCPLRSLPSGSEPRQITLGSGIKVPQECRESQQFPEKNIRELKRRFRAPTAQWPGSFCPIPKCRPWPSPGQSAGLPWAAIPASVP